MGWDRPTKSTAKDIASSTTVYVVDPSSGEALFACKQLPPQSFRRQQRSLEEEFLKLQWGDCDAWIGGSDAEEEGVWKWVTGPEAGQVFWRGGPQGKAVGYHNWLRSGGFGPEPNNSRGGQHYLLVGAFGGCWDDESGDRGKRRLIVEYSSE